MLYENQQIGNFNYQLGFYLGKNDYMMPFSINTFQQAYRHDKTVGDMFANLGGKYFILEFKRSKGDYITELDKKHRTKLIAKLMASPILRNISQRGHFLCHSEEFQICHTEFRNEYKFSEFHFFQYIDVFTDAVGVADNFLPTIEGMDEFARNIGFNEVLSGKHPIGMNFQEMKKYLELLKDCVGDDDYETTGSVSCFNSETNSIVSINFESLQELDIQLNLNLNHLQELGSHLKTTLDKPKLPPSKKNKGFTL